MFGRKMSPEAAAAGVAAAVAARDANGYDTAMRTLVSVLRAASPVQVQPALQLLVPVVAEVPLGPGAALAGVVGSIADVGSDPRPALAVLVERACGAMEDAARFAEVHRALLGEPPNPDDPAAIADTSDRFVTAGHGLAAKDAHRLVEAWFTGGDWTQPVLFLSQRADVRAALPQRERLLAAVECVREVFATADWLYGLLMVLDDEPLTVIHRPTGRGFRVTIGGIGDNFQLHTLLAAHLIGDTAAGWLPGARPSPQEIASADGTGEMVPPAGITGNFNLVAINGEWIWNEGRPADIPVTDGERVVILDPEPYKRSWNTGRVYPLMRPTLMVERQLSQAEAAAVLATAKPSVR